MAWLNMTNGKSEIYESIGLLKLYRVFIAYVNPHYDVRQMVPCLASSATHRDALRLSYDVEPIRQNSDILRATIHSCQNLQRNMN